MLMLARADAETEQLTLERLDLRVVVEEIHSGCKTLAETHGMHWKTNAPEWHVEVLGDQPYLRHLYFLLIKNAFRYTGTGGPVWLRLSVQEDEALIEVTDTGIDILFGELTYIFDRFYRASSVRFSHVDGSGFGLAIGRWIATANGDTLTAKHAQSVTCM